MNTALLIVNPHSGKKNGERIAARISEKLADRGVTCTLFISAHQDSIGPFLKETSLRDFDFVGLIGGDGTMHTFLNAALGQYGVVPIPVALFPCGTGNAFNLDIGCATVDQTLSTIHANKPAYIDIAEIQSSGRRIWSFNIIGCGLVADINRLAENLRWLGSTRYTIASLIRLVINPHAFMKITTGQGVLKGRFSFVLACNTRYTGKGMQMAPHAKLDDGRFDVIVVKACSALRLLWLFPKIFKGTHIGADVLHYLQTDFLEVTTGDLLLPTNIDGELKGSAPFSLKVVRNKVRVFMH